MRVSCCVVRTLDQVVVAAANQDQNGNRNQNRAHYFSTSSSLVHSVRSSLNE